MNHYVEVKEISFETVIEAAKAKNYPSSGLFMVRVEHTSDLRFVDKDNTESYCICPESVYNGLALDISVLPNQPEILTTSGIVPGHVSEQFVLDFTKVLLNK